MGTFRVHSTRDFTIINNNVFFNRDISWKAKGLLTQMLSLPDSWDYTEAGLATLSTDGITSTKSGLKELERAGYLTRTFIRDEYGRIADIDYDIYEIPEAKDELNPSLEKPITGDPLLDPFSDEPLLGSPLRVFPSSDFTHNKELINKSKNNKELIKNRKPAAGGLSLGGAGHAGTSGAAPLLSFSGLKNQSTTNSGSNDCGASESTGQTEENSYSNQKNGSIETPIQTTGINLKEEHADYTLDSCTAGSKVDNKNDSYVYPEGGRTEQVSVTDQKSDRTDINAEAVITDQSVQEGYNSVQDSDTAYYIKEINGSSNGLNEFDNNNVNKRFERFLNKEIQGIKTDNNGTKLDGSAIIDQSVPEGYNLLQGPNLAYDIKEINGSGNDLNGFDNNEVNKRSYRSSINENQDLDTDHKNSQLEKDVNSVTSVMNDIQSVKKSNSAYDIKEINGSSIDLNGFNDNDVNERSYRSYVKWNRNIDTDHKNSQLEKDVNPVTSVINGIQSENKSNKAYDIKEINGSGNDITEAENVQCDEISDGNQINKIQETENVSIDSNTKIKNDVTVSDHDKTGDPISDVNKSNFNINNSYFDNIPSKSMSESSRTQTSSVDRIDCENQTITEGRYSRREKEQQAGMWNTYEIDGYFFAEPISSKPSVRKPVSESSHSNTIQTDEASYMDNQIKSSNGSSDRNQTMMDRIVNQNFTGIRGLSRNRKTFATFDEFYENMKDLIKYHGVRDVLTTIQVLSNTNETAIRVKNQMIPKEEFVSMILSTSRSEIVEIANVIIEHAYSINNKFSYIKTLLYIAAIKRQKATSVQESIVQEKKDSDCHNNRNNDVHGNVADQSQMCPYDSIDVDSFSEMYRNGMTRGERYNNFSQRNYNYDELEKRLILEGVFH